jgi:DNA (cytosine-5)-methyltransferase 1
LADSFLLRNLPDDLKTWLDAESSARAMSKQEFTLSMLRRAFESDAEEHTPLLARVRPETEPAFPAPDHLPFRFVDLFAGIGGFRVALEPLGGKCVFSAEWDRWSQKTYREWFGETPQGDITQIAPSSIPDHDVLAAGFPCQPFSIAGVSKKLSLGRAHGFSCDTQGNLFFNLASIAAIKRPPVLFLENVKNLQSHDKGRTWRVILETLEDMRYRVFAKVIDAAGYVPQHRERVYIVGFDTDVFGQDPPFEFPLPPTEKLRLRDILEHNPESRYTLTDHLWKYLQAYAKRHQEKGNGFGFGLPNLDGVSRTLSARYFKDGSEILIRQEGKNPRRLTPRECSRLMGFGDRRIVVSDTQAYKQFGNAVVPPVVGAVGKEILRTLRWQLTRTKNGCLLKRTSRTRQEALSAEQIKERHHGVTAGRTSNSGRNRNRERASQIDLTQ